jgi:hypothetical protein
MKMLKLIESLLRHEAEGEPNGHPPGSVAEQAELMVSLLLGEERLTTAPLLEASVHRSRRSRIFVATFTGSDGVQIWKTTGLTDYDPALVLARRWEADARAQRARLDRTIGMPRTRVRHRQGDPEIGLTQKEVGQILHMSERGVREAERRALRKLRDHPLLKELWREYLSGELNEHRWRLDPADIVALLDLAATAEELHLVEKILRIVNLT